MPSNPMILGAKLGFMAYQFREVVLPDDLPEILRFQNEYLYTRPLTLEELREGMERNPMSKKPYRVFLVEDGENKGYGISTVLPSPEPGIFWLRNITVEPGAFLGLHSHLEAKALADGASKTQIWMRSLDVESVAGLEVQGYSEVQRNPESCLVLSQLGEKLGTAPPPGYEILSMTELERRYPETWQHMAWRIEMDLLHDVPLPAPFEEDPFEKYVKVLENPTLDKDAVFYALQDGVITGQTALGPNRINPSLSTTGLTGVLRDHRRKGLASALKLASYRWALGQGIEKVYTDNEENNPMYGLNLRLGFERIWDWVCLEKQFMKN